MSDPKTHSIDNDALRIDLNRDTGLIAGMTVKHNQFRWNQYDGNLAIRDDHADHTFSQAKHGCACNAVQLTENSATFQKRFADSNFEITETWLAENNLIRWKFAIKLDAEKPQRSIAVQLRIPWKEKAWGTMGWGASDNFPAKLASMVGTDIEYGDCNFGVLIPMLTLYRPKDNAGISVAKPLGRRVPRLRFCVGHWQDPGIDVEFPCCV